MATFEECNRLRREGNEVLYDYGNVSSISVTQLDTSYVLLAVFKGRYKKSPPENFFIGPVRVIAVKEEEDDLSDQYLDKPDPLVPEDNDEPVGKNKK